MKLSPRSLLVCFSALTIFCLTGCAGTQYLNPGIAASKEKELKDIHYSNQLDACDAFSEVFDRFADRANSLVSNEVFAAALTDFAYSVSDVALSVEDTGDVDIKSLLMDVSLSAGNAADELLKGDKEITTSTWVAFRSSVHEMSENCPHTWIVEQ